MKDQLLAAARAHAIPEGWAGLWYVRKVLYQQDVPTVFKGSAVFLPAGTYTYLYRLTDSTLYNSPPGEVVMEDTPCELRTHLQFMLKARGHVLVTGLGLGCVARGLLANPSVSSVTCVENSPDVLKLVQPHMSKDRLTIIEADALEWTAENRQLFDCAWHDLWTNKDAGDPHLDHWHSKLFINCMNYVGMQGAWGISRSIKKHLQRKGLELI